MDLGSPRGSEQAGRRPAVVVSSDTMNANAKNVIICPLTTNLARAKYPQNVLIPDGNGIVKPSVILGEQLRTVSKDRLDATRTAILSPTTMERLDQALGKALDLCLSPKSGSPSPAGPQK